VASRRDNRSSLDKGRLLSVTEMSNAMIQRTSEHCILPIHRFRMF
ncbi:unnamed protein product, partial [Oikopleura dioica]